MYERQPLRIYDPCNQERERDIASIEVLKTFKPHTHSLPCSDSFLFLAEVFVTGLRYGDEFSAIVNSE
jgi:TctA family transporter